MAKRKDISILEAKQQDRDDATGTFCFVIAGILFGIIVSALGA